MNIIQPDYKFILYDITSQSKMKMTNSKIVKANLYKEIKIFNHTGD